MHTQSLQGGGPLSGTRAAGLSSTHSADRVGGAAMPTPSAQPRLPAAPDSHSRHRHRHPYGSGLRRSAVLPDPGTTGHCGEEGQWLAQPRTWPQVTGLSFHTGTRRCVEPQTQGCGSCRQSTAPAASRGAPRSTGRLSAHLRSRLRTGAGVLPHPPGAHTRGLPQRRRRAAQCPGATDAPPPVAQSPVTAAELSGGQPGPSCQVVLRSNLAQSTERAAERRMHLADQWPDAVQRRLTTGKAGGVPTPPRVLASC